MVKGTAADLENLNMQTITGLLVSKVAYITNKGSVHAGVVMSVNVDCDGISSCRISKTGNGGGSPIPIDMVFSKYEDALKVAIQIAESRKQELSNGIVAMKGKIDNIRNNPETIK